MKKLSNTEAELKINVAYKKTVYLKYNPQKKPTATKNKILLRNQNSLTQTQYKAEHYQEN